MRSRRALLRCGLAFRAPANFESEDSMRPIDAYQTMAAIAVAAAAGACASLEAADRTEGTAVSQAVNGSIVGCASNPASHGPAPARNPQLGPFCSRKG